MHWLNEGEVNINPIFFLICICIWRYSLCTNRSRERLK